MTDDRLAFVDCETLGLDPQLHPVWELAVITGGEEHHWFVEVTEVDIAMAEQVALDLNGFHDRYDPTVALHPGELVNELGRLLDGKVIVGANPHFDLLRIGQWFAAFGAPDPWHYRPVCIESVLYGVELGWKAGADVHPGPVDVPWRASELYERVTGLTADEAELHTALGDARFVERLWRWAHG
jgi:hypothetical protein